MELNPTILIPMMIITIVIAASPRNSAQTSDSSASRQPVKTLSEKLGYDRDTKLLIVHADDLGMAHSVNAATIKAFESGLVTSGSVMVPCPWFPEVAAFARSHPEADLGLHLTLGSEWKAYRWGPVLSKDRVASLLDNSGYFGVPYSVMDAKEVEAEIRAQIDRALSLGIKPTHLDSHMDTLYSNKELFEVFLRVGRDYNLPVRIPREFFGRKPFIPSLLGSNDVVIDRFIITNTTVSVDDWSKFYSDAVKNIQPGLSEMVVHLAYDDEEMRAATIDHPDWGAAWRQRDFQFVTSDAFRRLLQENNIKLTTWREVGKLLIKSQKE